MTREASPQIRARVVAARQCQRERFEHKPRITCNTGLGARELRQYCVQNDPPLDPIETPRAAVPPDTGTLPLGNKAPPTSPAHGPASL